ncbi:SOL3 [Hepatospora eriocheir]|uniref:SOL3 n=1 Tax=Hepatospora eriocheir TaxID=1081669 RepID=A0A1X0QB25_9MICR|nr:SOL3 [Hepatospora eriocheir]
MKKQTLSLNECKTYFNNKLKKYSGRCINFMISGGSICNVLSNLLELKENKIDSSKWNIYFTDERIDKDNTNFKTAYNLLCKIKPQKINQMAMDYNNLEAERQRYEDLIKNVNIDIAIMGIGYNGHICSIWPNDKSIESDKYVLNVEVNDEFTRRQTITPKFINEKITELIFFIPLKDGKRKEFSEPDKSIKDKLNIEYEIILQKLK